MCVARLVGVMLLLAAVSNAKAGGKPKPLKGVERGTETRLACRDGDVSRISALVSSKNVNDVLTVRGDYSLLSSPLICIVSKNDNFGWTCLHHAADQGHQESLLYLLALKPNTEVKCKHVCSALCLTL
jgi:hypothetical protein